MWEDVLWKKGGESLWKRERVCFYVWKKRANDIVARGREILELKARNKSRRMFMNVLEEKFLRVISRNLRKDKYGERILYSHFTIGFAFFQEKRAITGIIITRIATDVATCLSGWKERDVSRVKNTNAIRKHGGGTSPSHGVGVTDVSLHYNRNHLFFASIMSLLLSSDAM